MSLEHYQAAFAPLLYGVALAIVPDAAARGNRHCGEPTTWRRMTTRNRKVRTTCWKRCAEPRAGPDRGRAPVRSVGAGRRHRGRREEADHADPRRAGREDPRGRRSGRHRPRRRSEIVDAPHSHESAAKAVALVREGEAELLMKGSLHTDELLGAVVARETGLRTGRRISHVFIMDVPTYHKVLIVTDAAINIAPRSRTRSTSARTRSTSRARSASSGRRSRSSPRSRRSTRRCRRRSTPPRSARWPTAGRSRAAPRRPARVRQRDQQGGGADQGHQVGGRRRSRHPARARPRGRQHPGEAAQLPRQRRQRRPGARRARADHPDQPRRQRALADRQLRRRGARGACAPARASRGLIGDRPWTTMSSS